MPIIKAKKKIEKEQIRISIERGLIENLRQYCDWANVKIDDFFEQAAERILAKDKDWINYIKESCHTSSIKQTKLITAD